MERIHAVTFAPFCARGTFEKEETRQSLKLMKEKTGANYVIFAPNGVQKTAFSENIDYRTKRNVSDEELTAMIAYAKHRTPDIFGFASVDFKPFEQFFVREPEKR